jgi:hypothetical protein
MSIYFKNKLKLCTLSTGKRESLMHSHVCSSGELVSQRGNVSESVKRLANYKPECICNHLHQNQVFRHTSFAEKNRG